MMYKSKGFTLIEIAIVLVIIGLLLGGVLKGQELITGARVRNLISQQDGIKAAFFGFQDRYRALPGDYAAASTNINGGARRSTATATGASKTPRPAATVTHEEILAWNHLTAAGFLNGSYTLASGAADPSDDQHSEKPLQRLHSAHLRRRLRDRHRAATGQAQPEDRRTDSGRDHRRGRSQDRRRQAALPAGSSFRRTCRPARHRADDRQLRRGRTYLERLEDRGRAPTAAPPACSKLGDCASGRAQRRSGPRLCSPRSCP